MVLKMEGKKIMCIANQVIFTSTMHSLILLLSCGTHFAGPPALLTFILQIQTPELRAHSVSAL